MIRGVLFDMDGTVIDSMPLYRDCWVRAAEEVGWRIDFTEHYTALAGMNHTDIDLYFKKNFGEDFPYAALSRARNRIIGENVRENGIPLKDGVPEIFDELHAMGCRVALVTSSNPARVELMMGASGLSRYFDLTVTGDRVLHGKPAPDIFLLGAKELGLTPGECVVAEDSINGAEAGIAAGMFTAVVPDLTPIPADLTKRLWKIGDSLKYLPGWIREENQKGD